MELLQRRYLIFNSAVISTNTGTVYRARRLHNEPEYVQLGLTSQNYNKHKISSLLPELQEQILLNLEYFEGSIIDAIRQNRVAGHPPNAEYYWVPEIVIPRLQPLTALVIETGIYTNKEIKNLFGEDWLEICDQHGIEKMLGFDESLTQKELNQILTGELLEPNAAIDLLDKLDPDIEWLRPQVAARLCNTSPINLNRWSDKGLVNAKFTKNGHRRYSRVSVKALIRQLHIGLAP